MKWKDRRWPVLFGVLIGIGYILGGCCFGSPGAESKEESGWETGERDRDISGELCIQGVWTWGLPGGLLWIIMRAGID